MQFDSYTSGIQVGYEAFAATLIGQYLTAQTSAISQPAAVEGLRTTGVQQALRFAEYAKVLTDEYHATLAHGAPADAYDRSQQYLTALLHVAIGNVNDLVLKLMGNGGRLADLLTQRAGAIGQLLQQRLAKPTLTATDTSGRSWAADKLVAVIARDYAYQRFIDDQLAGIEGDLVRVVHPDPGHRWHGTILSRAGEGYPKLEDLRREIFHPNSTAEVRPYVPA